MKSPNPMNRKGFTLIELLIVVVIIGILAAIAIPRFTQTRERAFQSAVVSDLRNLQTVQEQYYADPAGGNYNYGSLADLEGLWTPSDGAIDPVVTADGGTGWTATLSHQGLPDTDECEVRVGSDATDAFPSGTIVCTWMD